ncbi:sporulation protein YjcZ [Bacillus xiapuensis]
MFILLIIVGCAGYTNLIKSIF